MSNRLNQDREASLQTKRIAFAIDAIGKLGLTILSSDNTKVVFEFKGERITFFPYSGWASGKSIKDGRGWAPLFEQLKTIE